MNQRNLKSGNFASETDHFYQQEWSDFVREVDRLTGGGPVVRQLFFDAREKYVSNKN